MILRQAEGGENVEAVCRKHTITKACLKSPSPKKNAPQVVEL